MAKKLKRTMSLRNTILYGIGAMVGAGIFVLVGKVIGISGPRAPISFIVAGVVALLSGLSYAEMVSRYPDAAGASKYIYKAFKSKTRGIIIGVLIVASGLVSAGVLTNGFADYLQTIISIDHNLTIILVTLILGAMACRGIRLSSTFVGITAIIITITIIILAYLGYEGRTQLASYIDSLQTQKIARGPITAGAFLAYYVFVGFEDVVNNAEEIKNPKKNIPLALIAMIVATIVLYTVVVLTILLNNKVGNIVSDPTPVASIFTELTDMSARPITIAILIAASSSILVQIIMASRLTYGMAKQNRLPSKLAYIHPKTQTPIIATILIIIITLVGSIIGDISSLAKATSVLILCVFFSVHVALITLKIRERKNQTITTKHFTLPIRLPFLGAVVTILVLLTRFINLIG